LGTKGSREQQVAEALRRLNNDMLCTKCGTGEDGGKQVLSRHGGVSTQLHSLVYNAATDTLRVQCCRCNFEWDRLPDDRKL